MVIPAKLQEEDKRLHIAWSFWLSLTARILWPAPWAFFAVFLLGLAKECWDSRYGSGFCLFDICANIIGSTFALFFTSLLPGTLFDS
jgi:hypothetical protein